MYIVTFSSCSLVAWPDMGDFWHYSGYGEGLVFLTHTWLTSKSKATRAVLSIVKGGNLVGSEAEA